MILAFAIALAAGLALTPVAGRLARRFHAVSRPDGRRRLHARPMPLWGGGSLYLALLLGGTSAYFLVPGCDSGLWGSLMLSAGILCVLGCYDDLFDMSARWKLFWQIIATLPIVLAGGCVQQIVLMGQTVELGWLGIAFTVGWLVLGINAMNLLDGVDGLASLAGIVIALTVAGIAAYQGDATVLLLSLVLAGALIGFLVYNLPPARIYLGDCGSMIIGLTLALLVLRVSLVGPSSAARLTMATVLMFVPLLDTLLAVLRRTLNGHRLMAGDRGHIHHRLLERGFGAWQVLSFLGGLCVLTGAVAWLVTLSGGEVWAWSILATFMVMLVRRRLVGHVEWELFRGLVRRSPSRLLLPPAWSGLGNRTSQGATRNAPRLAGESPGEAPSITLHDPLASPTPEESVPDDASSTASAPVETDVPGNKSKKAA